MRMSIRFGAISVVMMALAGCAQPPTVPELTTANTPKFTVHNCDIDPDPELCDGGGGDGDEAGHSTSISYYAAPAYMGNWVTFPFASIGSGSFTYDFQVSYGLGADETSSVQGAIRWGANIIKSFDVTDLGTFSATTTGGAGQPDVRAKSDGVLPITFWLTCGKCKS